jgi:prephenate dehydrogenase
VRRRARASGAIAETAASLPAAAARAKVVVLAAHPVTNIRLLRTLAVLARPGLVITDVGSVKTPICREAHRLGLAGFVGGHPMAGTEGSGFSASSPDLFRGRPWILTTHRSAAARTVRSLVRAVGARPVTLAPGDHDRVAAFLSHAPQLAAWAILEMARRDPVTRGHLGLAGPGFRDMTRLAASPRPLWRQILRQNRAEIRRAMHALFERLRRSAP